LAGATRRLECLKGGPGDGTSSSLGTIVEDILSEAFRRRIVSTWGEKGRAWLERLSSLVTTCVE
jgi:hypothetical protein